MATEIVLNYRADTATLIAELDEIIKKNAQLLASTKGVKSEFKTLGTPVKSATKNVKSLTNATNKQTTATKKLTNQTKRYNKELKNTGGSLKKVGNTGRSIGGILAAAFSVGALIQFGKQAIRTAADLQSVRISLDFIEGSAAGGGETFRFLTETAEEFGLELVSTVKAYRSFSGATRLAGFSAQETQTAFKDVSSAVVALGLNAQQADRVFLALSQIVSKGVVSAEELRRQLGDALPGAFSIAAQSVGKTEAEFNKLLATGKILSQDFLPPFTKLLRETFAPGVETGAKSLNAELNRTQNRITELSDKIGKDLAPAWITFQRNALTALDAVIDKIKGSPALRALFGLSAPDFNVLTTEEKEAQTKKEVLDEVARYQEELIKIETAGNKRRAKEQESAFADELRALDDLRNEQEITEKEYLSKVEDIESRKADFYKESNEELAKLTRTENDARAESIKQTRENLLVQRELFREQKAANEPQSLKKQTPERKKDLQDAETALREIELKLDALNQASVDLNRKIAEDAANAAKKSTEEVSRALLDEIELRRKTTAEISELKKAEIAALEGASSKNKTVINKNLALIKKESEAREKQQKEFREFFEEATQLSEEDLEIDIKVRIKALGQDADTAFRTIANEFLDDLEKEKEFIDQQASSNLSTKLADVGIPDVGPLTQSQEADAAKITEAVVLDANRAKEASYSEYEKKVKLLLDILGIKEEEVTTTTTESWLEKNEQILQSSIDLYVQLGELSRTLTDARIADLERENEAFKDSLDIQREQLDEDRENRLITESNYQSQLKDLDDKELANDEKIRRKKNELAKKQAILDKSAALFQIALSTNQNIARYAGQPALLALVIALGLASAATVLATPIPKYALGTKGTKESGLAEVGERGRETVFLPQGSKVLNANKTKRYGAVLDSMADNKFDDYVFRNYITPALAEQSKPYEGLTYYDLIDANKRGVKISNIKDLAPFMQNQEVNTRRL